MKLAADGLRADERRRCGIRGILPFAFDTELPHHATTLQGIADFAGVGVSSLYSYFPSKLHLLYAVVEPWQKDAFERLEKRVLAIKGPRAKLRATLLGIWRDMPMENIGLANSLIEALASADPSRRSRCHCSNGPKTS